MGDRGSRHPLKNYQNIGFLSNTSADPLKNYKATKPALNVGPSFVSQQNAIKWHFTGGWIMAQVLFGSSFHLSPHKKTTLQNWIPPGSAHVYDL